jgi:hypothetical protein
MISADILIPSTGYRIPCRKSGKTRSVWKNWKIFRTSTADKARPIAGTRSIDCSLSFNVSSRLTGT